ACGTLGAVVAVGRDRYILSCNHVLAVNGRVQQADIVTPALSNQPKPIGKTSKLFVELLRGQSNSVDCAIAALPDADVKANFRAGKLVPKPGSPARGQKVRKDGAVTGLITGTVVDVNADFYIEHSFGTFLFTNQVVIEGDDDNFA